MKKFIAFAIVAVALAVVPMLVAVAAGAYLMFAAPTIFGVMLITGGVMYVTKNIIIAGAALSLIIAMILVRKAMKADGEKQDFVKDIAAAVNSQPAA